LEGALTFPAEAIGALGCHPPGGRHLNARRGPFLSWLSREWWDDPEWRFALFGLQPIGLSASAGWGLLGHKLTSKWSSVGSPLAAL